LAVFLALFYAIAIAMSAIFTLDFVFCFLVGRSTSPVDLSSSQGVGVGWGGVEGWCLGDVT